MMSLTCLWPEFTAIEEQLLLTLWSGASIDNSGGLTVGAR